MKALLFLYLLGLPGLEGKVQVVPGLAINDYKLGAAITDFETRLGNAKPWTIGKGPNAVELHHWFHNQKHGPYTGLRAYVRDGKVIQLSVSSKDMTLPSGIGRHSSIREIIRRREFACYEEPGSAGGYTGDENILYVADVRNGVALIFYAERNTGQPVMQSIAIFPRGGPLIPEAGHAVEPCKFSETYLVSRRQRR